MVNFQRGAALVVSLVLLVVALLLGLSSMSSSRLDESMAGNHRALNLAHFASEAGASRVFQALRSNGWPDSTSEKDELFDAVEMNVDVGDFAEFYIDYDATCWKIYDPDEPSGCEFPEDDYAPGKSFFQVTVVGVVNSGDDEVSNSRLIASFRQMPGFSDGAAYTCFGPDCSDTTRGNADLTGDDYHVPEEFDCEGNSCIAAYNEDGNDQDDAYYPDTAAPPKEECDEYTRYDENDEPLADDDPNYAYVDCDGRIYGEKNGYGGQDQWRAFLEFVETSGFDVVLNEGDELNFNVGGRDNYDSSLYYDGLGPAGFWDSISPRFIEVTAGAEVTAKASTNTLGVIVIREGAVFDYKGTSTHEGLIIIEPGGTLTFSSGNPQVYGGVVALESATGEMGEIITGNLELRGNMGIHYSSLAFEMLRQGGKGIRLVSWYVDVSDS